MAPHLVHSGLTIREKVSIAYAALEQGRTDHMEQMCAEDCEFCILGNPMLNPFAGTWVGIGNIRKAMDAFLAAMKPQEVFVESVIVNCDKASVHWHMVAEHVETARRFESERCDLLDFRDGLAVRIRCFFASETAAVRLGGGLGVGLPERGGFNLTRLKETTEV